MAAIQQVQPSLKICPSVPARQELTLLKCGDPNPELFAQALEEKPIRFAPAEDLLQALRYAMAKVGLRANNLPTKEERSILIHHILQYYGGHTIAEIRLAFDMALINRLDVDSNCYENFSCRYFSTIMNAYREWSKEQYKLIKREEPMIEYKESLSDQAHAEWYQEITSRVRAGGYQVDFLPLALYEWKDKREEIGKTAAEKKDYLVKAADYRLGQLADIAVNENTDESRQLLAEFAAMRRAGAFTGAHILHLKNLAKKMILFDLILGSGQQGGQPYVKIENKNLTINSVK